MTSSKESDAKPTEPWMDKGQLVEVDGQTYFLSLNPERAACYVGRWEPLDDSEQGWVREPKSIWNCDPGLFNKHPWFIARWALEILEKAGRPH